MIRLLVVAGILAATYFFIVRPVLQTTDHAISGADRTLQKSFGGVGKTLESVDRQVQRQIRGAFHIAKKNGSPKKLVRCIQRAEGDVHKIRRCTVKF